MSALPAANSVQPVAIFGIELPPWPRHLSTVDAASSSIFQWSLIRVGAQLIGSRLLAAGSVDELHDLLDEMLDQEDVCRLFQLDGESAAPVDAGVENRLDSAVDEALRLCSQQSVDKLAGLIPSWLDAAAQLRARAASSSPHSTPRPQPGGTLASQLMDAGIHPTLRRVRHSGMLGKLAIFALLQAGLSRSVVPAWLGDELLRLEADGIYADLRLLASLPEIRISETVVPAADRLDMESLQRENSAADRGAVLLSLLESARRQAMPSGGTDE